MKLDGPTFCVVVRWCTGRTNVNITKSTEMNKKFAGFWNGQKDQEEALKQRIVELEDRVRELLEGQADAREAETKGETDTEPARQQTSQPDPSQEVVEQPDTKPDATDDKLPETQSKSVEPEQEDKPVSADVMMELEKIKGCLGKELVDMREMVRQADTRCKQWQDKYDKLYQNVQEDRYRKDKVKLASRMIHHIDLLRRMLYDYNSGRDPNKPKDEEAQYLEKQIELIIAAMDDTLRHEMVQTLPMAKQGDIVNEELMEVIDTVPTADSALDGRVFRSVSACYYWTLPYVLKARLDEKGNEVRSYNFMLHPEEVIIYKMNK